EPDWLLEKRLAAWQLFEALPWPKPTDEAWRRTRLTGVELDKFQPVASPQTLTNSAPLNKTLQFELDEMASAASLVFTDGAVRHRATQEDLVSKGVIFTELASAVHA